MKDPAGIAPMTPQSTSIKIAAQLRERIIDGYFAPGQQINETHVSTQLNLSRGPLREALQRLSQEGLLVSKPNRGVFVVELTPKDVDEIFGVREILELGAAELIIARPAPQRKWVADKLLSIASSLSQAAEEGDWARVQRLDLEFHTALVAAPGNSRLLRAYATLATESMICMTNLQQAYPTPNSVTHHAVMADLIAVGAMVELRAAFHRHLSN
ncbi:GntR family transcriptional regulator [Paenarthrobacter sp. NPDC057981]|uniref:GntR family transcriptional regulator n=1 Tax=Paenarthrobacter sp. NPDC057981 TaxID=3346297 RepID=UPI0036DEA8A4